MAHSYKLVFKPDLLGMCSKICQFPSFQISLAILESELNDGDNFGKEQKGPTETHPFTYQKLYG